MSVNGVSYDGVFSTSEALDFHSGAGILNAEQALAEYDNFGKTSFIGEVGKGNSAFYYFDATGGGGYSERYPLLVCRLVCGKRGI